MSEYIITVTNSTASGTLVPDEGFSFTDNLNEINEAELKFSSLSVDIRGLISLGATVLIQKDGVNKFYGIIDNVDNVSGGGFSVHCSGYEIWLTKEPRSYLGSPWASTASATILSAVLSESTHISVGTIATGTLIDMRLERSDTLWNAIGMICRKTAQDTQMDYSNTSSIKISVVNNRGSASSSITLNNGFEIEDPLIRLAHPAGNSVTVFGKGDGYFQIKSTSAHGKDAASIATYGEIYRPVVNRNVMTVTEANLLADKEVATTKDPIKIYSFKVKDITLSISTGDIITVNAEDLGINNEDVRITQITRGFDKQTEYLNIQVANAAYSKILKRRDRFIGDIARQTLQESTQMNGSGNVEVWGAGINAKTSYPLKVGFNIDAASFRDQAGVLRISAITVDYELDKFKNGVGTASYTGSDIAVQNASGNTSPDVTGSSANTAPDVTGTSTSTAPGVSGTSGTKAPTVSGTSDNSGTTASVQNTSSTVSSITIGSSYVTVATVSPSSTATGGLFIWVALGYSGSSAFRRFRWKVASDSGTTYYTDMSSYVAESASTSQISSSHACFFIPENTSAYTYTISVKQDLTSGGVTSESSWAGRVQWVTLNQHSHTDGSYAAASHDHDDGSYAASDHDHADGTYAAVNHAHSDGSFVAADHGHPAGSYDINAADLNHISISSGVSESAAINSTSVNIYLDYYNGSTWINKHSILATGKTFDTGVDISNGGVYPDAIGYWRVRVEPITASADFAQAVVKIKHSLDN